MVQTNRSVLRDDSCLMQPNFFAAVLADNPIGFSIRAYDILREQIPGKAIVVCQDLELEEFQSLGFCKLTPLETPAPHLYKYWGGEDHDSLFKMYEQVVWSVQWNELTLIVVQLQWESSCGRNQRYYVVADTEELADSLILEVARKTHSPGESVLVFSNGYWGRNRALYRLIQAASFDDLILPDKFKDELRRDFRQFLDAENQYQRLGISWKRGALLIGPPGNGKTHFLRALIREMGIPVLYVQSLSHHHYTPEQMWHQVFQRARGLKPCVLILEDLDALVKPENRSFFLNQLDGLQQNHGLIVLATTNHPERIDSAIIDRPSRFDRKYHFELPTIDLRSRYLTLWQAKLADETGWRSDEVNAVAGATSGFSFAYLKELMISSVMKWLENPGSTFAATALEQAVQLRLQMKTDVDEDSTAIPTE